MLETICDKDFKETIPDYSVISQTLFGVDNVYDAQMSTDVELNKAINYPSHIGVKTLEKLEDLCGEAPQFGIEVGSFVGSSAAVFGEFMKESGGVLLCVDTWCGDINMWLSNKFDSTMDKKDGNPKIFYHFLGNIKSAGLDKTVIPFRVSSIVAARMIRVLKWKPDFVYLDSAHEAGETFMELSLFWNLLPSGGVLIGDDYEGFPAVKHDLDLFCRVIGQRPFFTGERDTWMLQKPSMSE